MYLSRYKLKAPPFGSEPDPDFFFLCDRHASARRQIDKALWYDEPCAAVLGPAGIGKTMLLQHLMDNLQGEAPLIHVQTVPGSALDLLRSLLSVLGFDDIEARRAEYRHILGAYLVHQQGQGSRPVLVLDNVEQMPTDALREICWLSTIGDGERAALHFLLFGRSEFVARLDGRDLLDLAELVRVRHELRGLSEGETLGYINHRLDLVGGRSDRLIPQELIPVIYRYSQGIPATINALCHQALQLAAQASLEALDGPSVEAAAGILQLEAATDEAGATVDSSLNAFCRDAVGKLVITHKGELCGTVPMDKERLVIGRHNLNNICIDSNAVSRCHAQIVNIDGAQVLMDMNSTNGTFVNFKRIQQQVLRDNDIIAIGRHRLKYVAGSGELAGRARAQRVPKLSETVVLDGKELQITRPAMQRVK